MVIQYDKEMRLTQFDKAMLKIVENIYGRRTYDNFLNLMEYKDARLLVLLPFEQFSYRCMSIIKIGDYFQFLPIFTFAYLFLFHR
jgi:hypothetical protein